MYAGNQLKPKINQIKEQLVQNFESLLWNWEGDKILNENNLRHSMIEISKINYYHIKNESIAFLLQAFEQMTDEHSFRQYLQEQDKKQLILTQLQLEKQNYQFSKNQALSYISYLQDHTNETAASNQSSYSQVLKGVQKQQTQSSSESLKEALRNSINEIRRKKQEISKEIENLEGQSNFY